MSIPAAAQPASAAVPSSSTNVSFGFDNTYARLPERFYSLRAPSVVAAPKLIMLNTNLAQSLRLDPLELASAEGVQILAGNVVSAGSNPLAQAYAGHQFGHFVPQLGDGRAVLLGEVIGQDGVRYDVQLKGSGRTAFSRGGDGRAALGPVLREYLMSEAMAALGVPTTRALAAVMTGERVVRETMLPGAVLTRVASSHLRVGTFQYFAARGDAEALRVLADYAIARHYPEAAKASRPYRAFLESVVERQAKLVAQWMLLGFIHGVMNTDNTSISGETIDYGPCAFMEAYESDKVFSSIDRQGRYAYANQPHAMHWNLTRLAEALLPLLIEEEGTEAAAVESAQQALAVFAPVYDEARGSGLRRKIGLTTDAEGDLTLAEDLLTRMQINRADFTLSFRKLCDAAAGVEGDVAVRGLFADPNAYDEWAIAWRRRLSMEPCSGDARAEAMRLSNPAFIPRNHLVQEVIDAAQERDDFEPFKALLEVVTKPFQTHPKLERYAQPATPAQCVSQTFCGT